MKIQRMTIRQLMAHVATHPEDEDARELLDDAYDQEPEREEPEDTASLDDPWWAHP